MFILLKPSTLRVVKILIWTLCLHMSLICIAFSRSTSLSLHLKSMITVGCYRPRQHKYPNEAHSYFKSTIKYLLAQHVIRECCSPYIKSVRTEQKCTILSQHSQQRLTIDFLALNVKTESAVLYQMLLAPKAHSQILCCVGPAK